MINLILISHGAFAAGMREAAEMILGAQEKLAVFGLYPGDTVDTFAEKLEQAIDEFGEADNTLILADLSSGTPSNTAMLMVMKRGVHALSGYNLPAKYILHTVGPIIQWEVTGKEEELLASCYRECLKLAADTGAESVAFCCLSTGMFRFPQQRAAEIATETVKNYINEDSRIKKVIFNVFKDDDLRIYHALIG